MTSAASNAKARQSVTSALRRMVNDVMRQSQVPSVAWAVVTSINSGYSTVNILQKGSMVVTPNVQYLDSYVPSVGDTVVCQEVGTDLWVIGIFSDGNKPIRGNPAGTIYATGQTYVNSGYSAATVLMAGSAGTYGGMTISGNGLAVPTGGLYSISSQLGWNNGGARLPTGTSSIELQQQIWQNSTQVVTNETPAVSSTYPFSALTIDLPLNAGDVVTLRAYQVNSNADALATDYDGTPYPGHNTWLSVHLVSQ